MLNARFIDPVAGENGRGGIADDLAIAQDRRALGDIDQRRLVALRHESAKFEATGKAGAGRQTEIIDDDRDIVALVELDVTGLFGDDFSFAHRCNSCRPDRS